MVSDGIIVHDSADKKPRQYGTRATTVFLRRVHDWCYAVDRKSQERQEVSSLSDQQRPEFSYEQVVIYQIRRNVKEYQDLASANYLALVDRLDCVDHKDVMSFRNERSRVTSAS
jgi:hypothetical protein